MVREMSIEQKIIYYYCTRKFSVRQTAAATKTGQGAVSRILNHHKLIRSQAEALKIRSTDDYRKKIGETKRGEKQTGSKLTEKKVIEIRSDYEKTSVLFGKTKAQNMLAQYHGVSRSTILDVIHGRTWTHV